MNTKSLLFLSCFVAVTLAASVVTAEPPRGGGNHSISLPARGGPSVHNGSGTWGGRHWNGGDWRHHHHDHFNDVIFISGFGFPFWGYPYGYGYGGYGYGGYPYGYGYGNGYYGGPGYGYGGAYYGGSGYGYGNGYYGGAGYGGYGYGSRSRVAQMQRRLAQAGYYHGSIDGIMGPRTRRAMHAYQRDHGMTSYGMMDRQLPISTG